MTDEIKEDAEQIQDLDQIGFNPIAKLVLTSLRLHTTQGRIMIPERNIDFFYEKQDKTFFRTKSGKTFELEEDLFAFMRWEEEDDEEDCLKDCEMKDMCDDKVEPEKSEKTI